MFGKSLNFGSVHFVRCNVSDITELHLLWAILHANDLFMLKSLSLRNLLVQNQNKDPPTCKYLHSYLGSFVEPWKCLSKYNKTFYPFTKWSSLLNCHHSSQTKLLQQKEEQRRPYDFWLINRSDVLANKWKWPSPMFWPTITWTWTAPWRTWDSPIW